MGSKDVNVWGVWGYTPLENLRKPGLPWNAFCTFSLWRKNVEYSEKIKQITSA